MPDTVASTVQGAMAGVQGEDPAVKAAVAAVAAAAAIPAPSLPRDIGFLWKVLIVGLMAALLISLLGLIFRPDTPNIWTVFSSVLTALIGLFVKSPLQK